jgi:protease I
VTLVGPTAGAEFKGKRGMAVVTSDLAAGAAHMKDFEALVIPGGYAPDKMRMRHAMVDLARDAMDAGKPVAAICHGPWLLVEADVLRGRTATAWPSIRTDLRNAGAIVVDEPAVTDGNIVTSRKPEDVEAFTEALIAIIEGAPATKEA